MLRKAELRDRLAVVRKAFDKETKEAEAIATKAVSGSPAAHGSAPYAARFQVVENITEFFKREDTAEVYLTILDSTGNAKVRSEARHNIRIFSQCL